MDATAWDEQYAAAESVWGTEPNRFVREQCERLPVGEAIDLACGEGRNAIWLASLGWRVVGVDFSAVAIERARDLTARRSDILARRVAWRVQDVTELQLKPGSLNLAIVSYLHLPPDQLEAVLLATAAALRPRGHLVIVGHDRRNLAEGVSGPKEIALLYDPAHLRGVLAGVDLVIEVARTAERPTDAGVALDTVVRARRKPESVAASGRPAG